MSEQQNVANFLKKIGEIKKNTFEAYLPSRGKSIKLQGLSLKQQKDIISSVADGVAGVISFTRVLNSIITEATGDNDLKTYDKAVLAVALRVNALGGKYKAEDKEIDLSAVLEKVKASKFTAPTETSVSYNGVTVDVAVPTLSEETVTIKKLEDEVKRNGEDSNTKNLASIYIYEIIKYVKAVTFEDTTITLEDLKIKERIDLIENLPLALNKQVIEFVEAIRKEERDMLTLDDVTVEIDPGIFTVER